MTNIYFPDEEITRDDVKFMCYMIERVARRLHQRNSYVVNKLGEENMNHLISVANVLHSKNPLDVEDEWISEYGLEKGNVDVNYELVDRIPTPLQMGKVYERLIYNTAQPNESEVEGIIRVYNISFAINLMIITAVPIMSRLISLQGLITRVGSKILR